jgi:dTDP-4-amino-4,6-dideoxygalactose transaminase
LSAPIPLSRPWLGQEEEQACLRVLRSGVLVQGPEGEALEAEFARRVGAKYAVAVSSGTAALQLSLMALSVGPEDEVVVPAYTFIATANAVRLAGARVVLADVDSDSLNLAAGALAQVIGPHTKAVVPVHQYGLPADLPAIEGAAPGVSIVEDAACAVGAMTERGPVGAGPGVAVCFSFHPRKVITTGEGGMITTADRELAERLRALRQHGQGEDGTREPGYNFRMSELAAALGRVQLGRLDEFLDRRLALAQAYQQGLHGLGWLQLPPLSSRHIFQSYVVRLRKDAPVSRETMLSRLSAEGIACQAGVQPIHHHRPYRDAGCVPLPVSEQAGRSAVFLPMFALMTRSQVERVCTAVAELGA